MPAFTDSLRFDTPHAWSSGAGDHAAGRSRAGHTASRRQEAPRGSASPRTGEDRPPPSTAVTGMSLLVRRLVAAGLDACILAGINVAVVYLTLRVLDLLVEEVWRLPVIPTVSFLGIFNLGYLVLLTAFGGQTLGKMATRLRVEGRDGGQMSVSRSLARAAACVVCVVPAGVGFLGVLTVSRRALQDRLAGTRVVVD
jgi:uncharacterized RDD family membrane protein YckC